VRKATCGDWGGAAWEACGQASGRSGDCSDPALVSTFCGELHAARTAASLEEQEANLATLKASYEGELCLSSTDTKAVCADSDIARGVHQSGFFHRHRGALQPIKRCRSTAPISGTEQPYISYERWEAAPLCRMCSRAVQMSVRVERASSVGRP